MQRIGEDSYQIIHAMPLIVTGLVRWKNDREIGPITRRKQAFRRTVVAIYLLSPSERSATQIAE